MQHAPSEAGPSAARLASLPRLRRSRAWRAASRALEQRAPGVRRRLVTAWGRTGNALGPVEVARDAAIGAWVGWRQRELVDQAERFVLFVGYPRSGHSVVGALLNAHPEMVVAHRMRALRYARAGMGRRPIVALTTVADKRFERRGRIGSKRYEYRVPTGWEGTVRRLTVAGDSNSATGTLMREPELLQRLRDKVQLPVLVVTVTRNPFDNIATLSTRNQLTIEEATDEYFERCATIAALSRDRDDWLFMRHEDLVADTRAALRRVCAFLGVEPDDAYLDACRSVVYQRPHRSRDETAWTPEQRDAVEKQIAAYPFLEGYAFEDHRSN